jgi:molybdopterin synthase sulfurtransferase
MKFFPTISTPELHKLINHNNVTIIDIRPMEAYNGWKTMGELHGGHIPGAKSLPFKWLNYIDWIEIVRHKNIVPENKIILYGYDPLETDLVARRFHESGYPDLTVYNHFVDEWANDEKMPLQRLERYANLVYPQWLNKLIKGEKSPEYSNNKYQIVHAHYRNRNAYLSGHIPGAIDMDSLALEAPETWNRRSPYELKNALEKHGITSDTTVILYGKHMFPNNEDDFPGSAAGDIGAIRCAFIMLYAGVKDVRILNGGFRAWEDENFEISYNDEAKIPAHDFGTEIPAYPELAVDTPEAIQMIHSKQSELVCVRSWKEYTGEVSGYNYIEKKGRIPEQFLPIAVPMPTIWKTTEIWTIRQGNTMKSKISG